MPTSKYWSFKIFTTRQPKGIKSLHKYKTKSEAIGTARDSIKTLKANFPREKTSFKVYK